MSFDLAVFLPASSMSDEKALEVYSCLCKAPAAALIGVELTESRKLDAFYRALVKKYPELTGDNDEISPWAATLDRSSRHVLMPIAWSVAADVADFVNRLAKKHGLSVFDPQSTTLRAPSAPADPAREPRTNPAAARKEFVAALTPYFESHGFAKTKKAVRGFVCFERAVEAGKQRVVFLEMRTSHPQARVEVEVDEAAQMLRSVGCAAAELPAIQCEPFALHRVTRSELPEDAYAATREYAICHRSCLDSAMKDVPASFDRFVMPILNRLTTAREVDGYFHDDRSSDVREFLNNWEAQACYALALARIASRSDFAYWVDHYRTRLSSLASGQSSMNDFQTRRLAAFNELVAHLGS